MRFSRHAKLREDGHRVRSFLAIRLFDGAKFQGLNRVLEDYPAFFQRGVFKKFGKSLPTVDQFSRLFFFSRQRSPQLLQVGQFGSKAPLFPFQTGQLVRDRRQRGRAALLEDPEKIVDLGLDTAQTLLNRCDFDRDTLSLSSQFGQSIVNDFLANVRMQTDLTYTRQDRFFEGIGREAWRRTRRLRPQVIPAGADVITQQFPVVAGGEAQSS